jgi:hypothetical protein
LAAEWSQTYACPPCATTASPGDFSTGWAGKEKKENKAGGAVEHERSEEQARVGSHRLYVCV